MQGADVVFRIQAGEGAAVSADAELQVYTTRPDTLFGVTYMVVAPEHPLLLQLTSSSQKTDVDAYVQAACSKSDLERTGLQKDKTGIFTGKRYVTVWLQQLAKPCRACFCQTFFNTCWHELDMHPPMCCSMGAAIHRMQGATTLFTTHKYESAFNPQSLEGVNHGFTLLHEQAGDCLL